MRAAKRGVVDQVPAEVLVAIAKDPVGFEEACARWVERRDAALAAEALAASKLGELEARERELAAREAAVAGIEATAAHLAHIREQMIELGPPPS